jgi:Xaa-Pro aminopeptidase
MELGNRWTRLLGSLHEGGADALLTTQPENRRYLTGFAANDPSPQSSAGWAVVTRDGGALITSPLYAEEAHSELVGVCVVEAKPRLLDGLSEVLRTAGVRRLAFEPEWLTVQQQADIGEKIAGQVELVALRGQVEALRECKDEDEIAAVSEAIALTDLAFEHMAARIKPGMTERQVAWDLERFMRERGSEGMAFDVAVASGPATAVPHHSPSERPIGTGEPVWIDMGARVRGYCGDLTRSFCLGVADTRFREIYDLVLQAQLAAENGLRAGMTGVEADALARDVIAAAGHGQSFTHSLGHGIGLAIHENPRLSSLWPRPIREGVVTSVEPGVYLPGWGGIRIEDVVVVRKAGAKVLTRSPKDPIIN